jgi:hypothetical protein
VLFAIRPAERLQPLIDDRRDPRDDVGRDVVQARHARQHVDADVVRQQRDQLGCRGRIQVRQNQRDGLRMLAEDELRQLLRIRLLQ